MRVSITTIEQFRLVVATDWCEEADLVAQIIGKRAPTPEMEAGTAFHAAMAGLPYAGCEFRPGDISKAQDHVGPGVKEVKIMQKVGDVELVGVADLVCGKVIHDYKCKFSGPGDPKHYEQSLQWRMYLWAFGADRFDYDLFQIAEADPCCYLVKEVTTVSFYRYPDLARDCLSWVEVFVDWARKRRLIPYLERQGSSLTVEVAE